MRYQLFFLASILFFTQCKNKKDISIDTTVENITGEYEVSGIVTSSQSYCGGARPTDEILYQLTTPKPLANETFYVREGNTNSLENKIVSSFTTDGEGKFKIKLPKGNYLIVDYRKKDNTYTNELKKKFEVKSGNYSAIDTVCLNSWLETPLTTFTLDSTKKISITWNIHQPCSWGNVPCAEYLGPYPP